MLHTHNRLIVALLLVVGLIMALAAFTWTPGASVAGGGLPPRPTPSPTPVNPLPIPTSTSTAVPSTPINGAAIQLHTSEPLPGAWTIVEWQNEHGKWYEVQGWRGHLDDGNTDMKIWWVYPANYGEGPFRWVVYAKEGGAKIATSDSFDLPTRSLQVVTVEVEIP